MYVFRIKDCITIRSILGDLENRCKQRVRVSRDLRGEHNYQSVYRNESRDTMLMHRKMTQTLVEIYSFVT